jgi:carbamoyltransferase
MSETILAVHTGHNAAAAVYHNNDFIILELERLLNYKNASWSSFRPTYSAPFIADFVYNFLKERYGITHYNKLIVGELYDEVSQEFKDAIPADEYAGDYTHHAAHIYGSFCQSNFTHAIGVSYDGGGIDGSFNLYELERGKEPTLIALQDYDLGSYYHTLGLICEDIKNTDGLVIAGKLLGLQSYGNVVEDWIEAFRDYFRSPKPYWQNLDQKLQKLSDTIGIAFSAQNKLAGQLSYDFAKTGQYAFEQVAFELMDKTISEYDLPIVVSGGCALNIVMNTKIKEKYSKEVFIAQNSTEVGLAFGYLCKHVKPELAVDITYKGVPVLDKYTLLEYIDSRYGAKVELNAIVEDLANNRILGVVQGNAEHGPRALGNRSIICSPISPDMKDILNFKVKHREWFRPFAPIVRLEDVSEYFEWEGESRWMNFCPKVKPEYIDKIPAVVHVDGTARVQTVTREQNSFIYDLLTEFKAKTGIGVLVNTSFNVDGKPILSTYKDAFKVFDETQLDRLYLDGYYFRK